MRIAYVTRLTHTEPKLSQNGTHTILSHNIREHVFITTNLSCCCNVNVSLATQELDY